MSALTGAGSTRRWRALRQQVLAEEPVCRWCPSPATTVDHILARAHGGTDERSNLAGSCAPCNYRRGAEIRNDSPRHSRSW